LLPFPDGQSHIALVIDDGTLYVLGVDRVDKQTEPALAVVDNTLERCQLAFDRPGLDGFAVLEPVLKAPVAEVLKVLGLQIDDGVGAQRSFVTQEALQPV
jgi:hypothetical protein